MLGRVYIWGTALCIAAALLAFMATRHVIIDQAPKRVMATIEGRIAQGAGGWNACFHNRTYGPRTNAARRANPDSIISSMAYDLSDGPVRIKGETWHRYWSLSFYQQNSDNYYVINDQELPAKTFDFVLTLDPDLPADMAGTPIVSPTQKGIMLIRRFAADAEDMPAILENQDGLYCGPA